MSDTVRTGAFTRTQSFGPASRDSVIPRFHIESIPDPVSTAASGRPRFKSEERVQFIMPGSPNQPVFKVNDEHRQRWPDQYAAFKRGEEMALDGTPLEQWPVLTRTMVLELKAIGLHTVEQCAGMSDTAVQKVGRGGYNLRERAKAYLDDAEAGALTERLNRENDLLNEKNASMQRQLDEQRSLLDSMHHQLMAIQNAPSAVESHVPGQHDPFEAARQGGPMAEAEPSALDGLAAPARRKLAAKAA